MNTRRVVHHKSRTNENDLLQVITIFEPNANKETVKKELVMYSKKHEVLVLNNKKYDYVN